MARKIIHPPTPASGGEANPQASKQEGMCGGISPAGGGLRGWIYPERGIPNIALNFFICHP